MKRKELEENLIKEGKSLVPNKIDSIYQKLGISFLDEKNNNSFIEEKIKKEGNILLKNVRPDIVNKQDEWSAFYENKIEDEKNKFVPNIKDKLGIKKENPFVAFFKKPSAIALSSTFAIAVITTSVVLVNAFNNRTIIDNSNSNNSSDIEVVTLNGRSTVNFKVESGSGTYKPEVVYSVETTGYINNNSIVATNDSSKNILSGFSSKNTNQVKKLATNNAYTITSFTGEYLNIALNLGYIERKNANETNTITMTINYGKDDESYYKTLTENLETKFNQFIYENKIIAELKINSNSSSEDEDELTQLIRQAYEISINLFTDENGEVNKVLCFSTDFNDWLEKYKDYSVEELEEYVEFLIEVNEKISNDKNKYLFIDRFSEITKIQTRIDELNTYYNKLSQIYDELSVYLDDAEKEKDGDMDRPDGKDGYEWDWWDDVGHNHKGPRGLRRWEEDDEDDYDDDRPEGDNFHGDIFDKEYEQLIVELDALIARKETINVQNKMEVRNYLKDIRFYSRYLSEFYIFYSDFLDEELENLLDDLDKDTFNNDKPDYHKPDEEMPDDWDDDFDDWWDSHKGHRH